ncbi:MAG: ATP-binding protein [Prevotella sp.]|nr:ATP-binding protein [Prevotella sp.]MDY6129963.1 ATP-binding protein [Prevotella sp.]
MRRKVFTQLKKWKESKSRKPLILLGARQVGKTWLMKEFGKACYDSVAYINCDAEPLAKELFTDDYNIDRILFAVQAITGVRPEKERTLIVFDEIQDIIEAYRNDIPKHSSKTESVRIGQVLDSLPSQLAKENKKFIYGVIKQGARAKDYELAIQWLIDAGIIHKVSRVKEIQSPLKFYEDLSAFKLFLLDCGLFACMVDAPAKQMLVGDNVFKEFKGSFTEQYVLQQLVSMDITPYCWSNDKTPAEIDFVVQTEDRVIPIEVKAEENVRSRSVKTYIDKHSEANLKGLRLSMRGYVNQDWMENVPLYGIRRWLQ